MGNKKGKEINEDKPNVDENEKTIRSKSMFAGPTITTTQPELYNLINPKGGGVMVELAKQTLFKKKPKEFEEFVLKTLPDYLINEGKEELIPVAELIQYRKKNKKNKSIESDISLAKKLENVSKEVVFDIDQRGVDGETLLHLCLDNGSYIHLQIARFLLKMYPKLVNDIYLSEEYYGSSPLHQSIVNEDPVMCKLLLRCGANVHQRAAGRFFLPNDQKNKVDWSSSEYPRLPTKTNYQGICYYGEYPLSFAAILDQEECIRLLLAYGADINKQDSNGNSALHMTIIHNKIESAKTLIDLGANLDILNNQDLSALTLAAKLAREEIFSYIMEHTKKSYWTYADITCAAYPLKFLDPVREDGSININSALYLVLNSEKHEYLNLLKGVLHYLITEKWDAYVKYRFYSDFFIYCLFYILNGVSVFLKRSYYDFLVNQQCTASEQNELLSKCQCAYLYPPYEDNQRYARTVIEMIIFAFTIGLILQTFRDIYVQRPYVYLDSLMINPFKIALFASLLGNLVMIPLRLSCNTYGEDLVQVVVIILLGTYILYFGRGFRSICIYVYNIHVILRHNMLQFIIVYVIIALGISQGFLTIFMYLGPYYPATYFDTWLTSFVSTFALSLAEVEAEYDKVKFHSSYTILGIVFTNFFLVVGNVLMIVTLIASMDYTQEETAERELEWVRQWGLQVLSFEFRVSQKDRKKHKCRYVHTLADGGHALLVRWKLDENEMEESKETKAEFMKSMHQIPVCETKSESPKETKETKENKEGE